MLLPLLNETKYLYFLFRHTVESSPVSPATPSQAVVGSAVPVDRNNPVSKSRRYAHLFKSALDQNYRANRGSFWQFSRADGLSVCLNGEVVVKCVNSHRQIKSAYFLFCLCEKDIGRLKEYLHNHDGQIPDCGEISPEDSREVRQRPDGWPTAQNLDEQFQAVLWSVPCRALKLQRRQQFTLLWLGRWVICL